MPSSAGSIASTPSPMCWTISRRPILRNRHNHNRRHMSEAWLESSKRPLEPIDRISEVLFGLIMVLTFTGSLSVAEAGHEDIRTMLIGALGCNLAWGVIDGILYLMG